MKSNISKVIIGLFLFAILLTVGWTLLKEKNSSSVELSETSTDLELFESENYTFNYPKGYSVILPTESFPALTLEKAPNQKLEIFQIEDFGDRPWGFSGTETQEEVDSYMPKETLTVENVDKQYDVWLYYSENDIQTQAELKFIFDSIVIK